MNSRKGNREEERQEGTPKEINQCREGGRRGEAHKAGSICSREEEGGGK